MLEIPKTWKGICLYYLQFSPGNNIEVSHSRQSKAKHLQESENG